MMLKGDWTITAEELRRALYHAAEELRGYDHDTIADRVEDFADTLPGVVLCG